MAMTTNSSTSVNARRRTLNEGKDKLFIETSLKKNE
jgi:hypothetical protein